MLPVPFLFYNIPKTFDASRELLARLIRLVKRSVMPQCLSHWRRRVSAKSGRVEVTGHSFCLEHVMRSPNTSIHDLVIPADRGKILVTRTGRTVLPE